MHEFQKFKMFLEMPFMRCPLKNVLCVLKLMKTIVVIIMGLLFKIIRINAGWFRKKENLL